MRLSLPVLSQPKLQIANLVEASGIPVPRRFGNFDEALRSGVHFIARSEHPREFAGESGLLDSFPVTEKVLDEARHYQAPSHYPHEAEFLFQRVKKTEAFQARLNGGSDRDLALALATSDPRTIREYCRLYGIRDQEFLQNVSYSYWRLLEGWNRTIVADNAIPGRYHIFTTDVKAFPGTGYNYAIIDNDRIAACEGPGIDHDAIIRGAAELIGFYEAVRNLPIFDPNHCPIVECQLVDGVHYFLQYHIGRDAEPSGFELTRSAQKGEVEATFVRGATPPDGLTVQAAYYYPYGDISLESEEDASFDYHYFWIFSEIMFRRRQVQLIDNVFDAEQIAASSSTNHLQRTKLFKPRVSVAGNFKAFVTSDELHGLFEKTKADQKPARIPYHVVSDGRRALVRREG
jgi:hypothetical protein